MLSWVVTFRPTPRRSRKSHSHCALPRFPENVRRSDVQTFTRLDYVFCQTLFIQSITGSPAQRQSSISFPFNSLRTLFVATEGYTLRAPGLVIPNASQGGTHPFIVLCFHALMGAHFATPFLSYSSRNGGVYPPTPFGRWDVQTCGRSDESFRPIAVHILWCHNPQRHQISLRSGETTPLLPVSKILRADNGDISILVLLASRA